MSWAQIVKTSQNKTQSRSLIVKYNVNLNRSNITSNNKVVVKDASDNNSKTKTEWNGVNPKIFNHKGWIHYKKNKKLNAYKKTLPISIQRIIEWAKELIGSKKITDLNFDEIDNDLKIQYDKYKNKKTKFTNVCFNSNHVFFQLPHYNPNMVQFLFGQVMKKNLGDTGRGTDKLVTLNEQETHKLTKQSLMLIKLLIINNFADPDHQLYNDGDGDIKSVFEATKRLIWSINEAECSVDIIDDWIDLMMVCVNKKNITQQEAIFRITIADKTKSKRMRNCDGIYCENLLDDFRSEVHFPLSKPENHKLFIRHNILQKLLFRGMFPFQFIEQGVKLRPGAKPTDDCPWIFDDSITQPFQDESTKMYIDGLMKNEKVFENTLKQHPMTQMAVLSPLVLLPYVSDARKTMNNLLLECIIKYNYIQNITLSTEISNSISSFLFINYNYFYGKEIQNNLNVKAIVFLSYMSQFVMDDFFVKQFQMKYCDKQFVEYLINNYLYSVSYLIAASPHYMSIKARKIELNVDVIRTLIETYNNNRDSKLPLGGYGIYFILKSMMDKIAFDERYPTFIKMIKVAKDVYGKEFDVMHFHLHVIEDNDKISNSWGSNKKELPGTLIPCIVDKHYWVEEPGKMEIISFILSEFRHDYDIHNPCLLYFSLERRYVPLFEYLINHYDYTIDKICDTMIVADNPWKKNDCGFQLTHAEVLNKIKRCCLLKYNNERDMKLLDDTINKIKISNESEDKESSNEIESEDEESFDLFYVSD